MEMKIKLRDSEKLKRLLLIKGFSQGQLASDINITVQHLNAVVNGKQSPSGRIAKRIADQLEVGFEDIFFVEVVCCSKQGNQIDS